MPEDKSAVEDFLGSLSKPQNDPFKAEIPVEEAIEEGTEEEVEEEKSLPFHKDPKVQRFIEKEITKRMADFKPVVSAPADDLKLPESFIKLVGNDTDEKKQVLKDLSNYFSTLKGEARQEFLQEMKNQETQKAAEDNAALEELNQGFDMIEEAYGVDLNANTKTRAAFVDYLQKVSHKNAEGEVDQFADIPAAWEHFQAMQTKPVSRAKQLASRSIDSSKSATENPQGIDKSWKGVEKFLSTLSK